jgi:hypothetical protein
MGETILNGFALEITDKLDKFECIKINGYDFVVWMNLPYLVKLVWEGIRELYRDYSFKWLGNFFCPIL